MIGLRKSRMERVKEALKAASSYTDVMVHDERLRSDMRSAVGHGAIATDRMRQDSGLSGLGARLATDRKLHKNLRSMLHDLDSAGRRVRRKRDHRVRNALLIIGGSGVALAAVPNARRWGAKLPPLSHTAGTPSVASVK
jgi:hypothetical protein